MSHNTELITPFLIGEKIYLRPLQRDDLPAIRRWANDPEIRRLTGEATPMNEAAAEAFLARTHEEENRVWFMVIVKATGSAIGETGLLRMFPAWRTTDLSIIIGERDAWGHGYGAETAHLMLDYAFGYLNVHRVSIGVVGFNERALRFYERLGFRREGIQRDGYFYNHRYHDFIMMSILEDEFRARGNS
ncbi:MAG: GNAT family N-acetyltransferase [Anaerolineae bacterium]|nr:GNAT family N-acetyltransferase [Anaerolineae bacterium]